MNLKLFLVFIAAIISLNCVNFVKGENNGTKVTNWILYKDDLYFIEDTKLFTSQEAQNFCIKKEMVYKIERSEMMGLLNMNGKVFWLLNEDYLVQTPMKRHTRECFAWIDGGIYPESCNILHNVICKTKINGASLQYKNGTFDHVGVDEANRYCNPQSDNYDDELEYCLIEFQKLLL